MAKLWASSVIGVFVGSSFLGGWLSEILSYYVLYPLIELYGVSVNLSKIKIEVNESVIAWFNVYEKSKNMSPTATMGEVDAMVNELFEAANRVNSNREPDGLLK